MTNATPWFVPDFRVRISGQPVPAALRASIMSVHCQSGIEGADRVEIAVVNKNLQVTAHPGRKPDRDLDGS